MVSPLSRSRGLLIRDHALPAHAPGALDEDRPDRGARHGGRSHAFPLPGMLEPFFETGGFGRRGGGWRRVTCRRQPGQGLFLQIRAPALAMGGAGHRVTGRAAPRAGQAGACPYVLPEGPQRSPALKPGPQGRRRRRCAAGLTPEGRPRTLARRVPRRAGRGIRADRRPWPDIGVRDLSHPQEQPLTSARSRDPWPRPGPAGSRGHERLIGWRCL